MAVGPLPPSADECIVYVDSGWPSMKRRRRERRNSRLPPVAGGRPPGGSSPQKRGGAPLPRRLLRGKRGEGLLQAEGELGARTSTPQAKEPRKKSALNEMPLRVAGVERSEPPDRRTVGSLRSTRAARSGTVHSWASPNEKKRPLRTRSSAGTAWLARGGARLRPRVDRPFRQRRRILVRGTSARPPALPVAFRPRPAGRG